MPDCVFPYPGGKSYLANWIISQMPEHDSYVELFGGSAAVLVNKPESRVEVFNDLDGDIVHFLEVLRDSRAQLQDWCSTVPYAKDLHEKWGRQWYQGWRPDDPIERAGIFYYLRNTQFAGKYRSFSGFASSTQTDKAGLWGREVDSLEEFAARLRDVQIENRDYAELLGRFDGENVLFYADPPYVEEGDALYSHEGAFDHSRFVDEITDIEGRWMVSYMDLPPGLADYHIVEKGTAQHMNKHHGESRRESATERLVMNFDPKEVPKVSDSEQSTLVEVNDAT